MKERIIELLDHDNVSMSISEIADVLGLNDGENFKEVAKAVIALEDEGVLFRSKKDKYSLLSRLGYYQGVISIHDKGFGFLILKDEDDIFIPKDKINEALNNDEVLVQIKKTNAEHRRREGKVIKILKHNFDNLVGTYIDKGEEGVVKIDDKKNKAKIVVKKNKSMGAMTGHKVLVEVYKDLGDNVFEGAIQKIIGHENDPGVDILSVIYRHGIKIPFDDEVLNEATSVPEQIAKEDYEGREDLRDELIITIDGADAKDLDDAVSVKRLDSGNYLLSVHIADVSHYVKEDSALDKSARDRGTSVYLVDRVIPMIPHRLSNGICSLNPNVDRLTMSCDMEIDNAGNVVNSKLYQSVIKTTNRMTYSDCNAILESGDKKLSEEYFHLLEMLYMMRRLSKILRNKRTDRGALDFELPEAKIIVDDQGFPIDVELRERGTSEKIIEDFMLAANETVAETMHWLNLPFVYRIHDKPKEQKIVQFYNFVRILGYKIKGKTEDIHPMALSKALDQLQGEEEGSILRTLLLRSMQKAVYSPLNIGHFGLASKNYTHFTSPIRRYPDLMVHRLIREYIINGDVSRADYWATELHSILDHSSNKERTAQKCEYDVRDMKMAEYMSKHIGEEFDGVVSSVLNFGMFIELPNTVEGLVHVLDMKDDYYHYDEQRLCLVGERRKKTYKIGTKVKIRVTSTDKDKGTIDFEVVDTKKRKRWHREGNSK